MDTTIIQLTGGASEPATQLVVGSAAAQSVAGRPTGQDMVEVQTAQAAAAGSRYRYDPETEAEFGAPFYQGRNLTYPKMADETSTSSPKRLSLDER